MDKNNWTYKKLGEVCKTSSGGTPSKSHKEYYEGGSIPWLRSGEVAQGLIYDTELCITELGLEKSSAKIFPIDTVVIAMYGATVGQVGILKCEMSTNQAVCGIFPNSKLYPLFLLYCLKSKKSLFLKDAVGGAQPNISQNLIKNTVIPIPPLAEQERIVAELDLLTSIIDKKKAQLKELDQLAQSIFYDMFGDPITNEKGWEMKSLGGFCEIKGRIGFRGYTKNDFVSNSNEGAISLSPTNIVNGSMDYSKCSYVTWDKYFESPEIMIQNGDILLVKTGSSYGKCSLVRQLPHEATINPQFVVIKDIKQNNIYLTFVLSSDYAKYQYDRFVLGTAIPTFSQKSLSSLPIPLPPPPSPAGVCLKD